MPQQYPDRPRNEMDRLNEQAVKLYQREFKDLPPGDRRAILFNIMQKDYESLPKFNGQIIMKFGNTTIRAFGNDAEAQQNWNDIWRTKFPQWGPLPAGGAVSVNAPGMPNPEIWINDLRQDANGKIVLPPHILIHEQQHELNMQDPRIQDPHDSIRNESYAPMNPLEKGLFERLFE